MSQYEAVFPNEDNKKIICRKCGRELLAINHFFSMPHAADGKRYPVCKECLTAFIDNKNPETFLWVLEELDIPYVEEQ